MIFIRGNNVYPSAVEAVVREFTEVAEYRLRVLESEELSTLEVDLEPRSPAESTGTGADEETSDSTTEDLAQRVARAIQDRLLFRARVRLVPSGSLPRFEMKAQRVVRESKASPESSDSEQNEPRS
jgi:phenylacetate-CoA ligase